MRKLVTYLVLVLFLLSVVSAAQPQLISAKNTAQARTNKAGRGEIGPGKSQVRSRHGRQF